MLVKSCRFERSSQHNLGFEKTKSPQEYIQTDLCVSGKGMMGVLLGPFFFSPLS